MCHRLVDPATVPGARPGPLGLEPMRRGGVVRLAIGLHHLPNQRKFRVQNFRGTDFQQL